MSLNQLLKEMHPICKRCHKLPAKKLPLPGLYGAVIVYCSLRCAATDAVEPAVAGKYRWCPRCQEWHDEVALGYCQAQEKERLGHE